MQNLPTYEYYIFSTMIEFYICLYNTLTILTGNITINNLLTYLRLLPLVDQYRVQVTHQDFSSNSVLGDPFHLFSFAIYSFGVCFYSFPHQDSKLGFDDFLNIFPSQLQPLFLISPSAGSLSWFDLS